MEHASALVINEVAGPAGILRTVEPSRALPPSATVALFANGAFVDTTTEAANLVSSLAQLGCAIRPFSGTLAADFAQATKATDILVIPELEIRDLNASMDDAARDVLRQFVADGGIVVHAGDNLNNDVALANDVFGLSLVDAGGVGDTRLDTAGAAGTAFEGGASTLPGAFAVSGVATGSLPEGAESLYSDGSASSVFAVRYGAGAYVYLGFDWFASPTPAAWQDVLGRALQFAPGDRIVGTDAAETLTGGHGRDDLSGLAGDDLLIGGAHRDGLDGGAGDDTLLGGAGDDVARGGSGDDVMDGGAGNDEIAGAAGSDTLSGGRDGDVFVFGAAEAGDAVIDRDVITDYDVLSGDVIALAEGVSVASWDVSPAGLTLTLTGGDQIVVQGVTDREQVVALTPLSGSEQADSLDGTAGDDSIAGHGGVDTLSGEAGRDLLRGDEGTDLLDGGAGADSLQGGGGADTLSGGDGADVLDGGSEGDRMAGGTGDDAYFVDATNDVVIEVADEGRDSVISLVSYTLGANVEDLTLAGAGGVAGSGNGLDNALTGNGAGNELSGLAGADSIFANAGEDWLRGGAGNDLLVGGAGADLFFFAVEEAADGAVDRDVIVDYDTGDGDIVILRPGVQVMATAVVGGNTVLTLTGGDRVTFDGVTDPTRITVAIGGSNDADSITGTEDTDTILGFAGDDTLEGGRGADVVSGGAGNDLVEGEEGDDRLEGDDGGDTLDGGDGSDALSGGSGRDSLFGGAGNDTLNGGGDLDLLFGMQGDDTFVINDAGDVVLELSGQGVDTVITTLSFRLGENVENLRLTGIGSVAGSGNALANEITGNEAANRLDGLSGNDTLGGAAGDDAIDGGDGADLAEGGTGNDVLLGGNGEDTLAGGEGSDTLTGGEGHDVFVCLSDGSTSTDVIVDFETGVDQLDLRDFHLPGLDQLAGLIVAQGADTLIDLRGQGGDAVLLQGVSVLDVSADDVLL